MTLSTKYLFRKCGLIRSFLRIWSYLLKKPLMENFIFCAVLLLIAVLSAITVSLLHNGCSDYFLQVLLSAIFISYCFLFLLATLTSYSYQVVVTTPHYISYFCEPVISATFLRYCYHVTLSHTPISYSNQLFLSGTFIS